MQLYTSDNESTDGLGDYPPAAFFFRVEFSGLGSKDADSSFQDVSGIGRDMKTEEYAEGGENTFIHRLPGRVQSKNLVLKRGIAPKSSALIAWCNSALEGGLATRIEPKIIVVSLMNVNAENTVKAIRAWKFNHAYPVKWEVDNFNSTKNDVAIETIELAYHDFSRVEK